MGWGDCFFNEAGDSGSLNATGKEQTEAWKQRGPEPRAQLTLHGGGKAGCGGGRSADLEPGGSEAGQEPWFALWRRRQSRLPVRRKKELSDGWQRFSVVFQNESKLSTEPGLLWG